MQLLSLALLLQGVERALAASSCSSGLWEDYDICERVSPGPSNQDVAGSTSPEACVKSLFMYFWPKLPRWTMHQWCRMTGLGEVNTSWSGNIPSMHGKTALVTGGDTGLGFATMKALAESGVDVAYTSRNCDCRSNAYSVSWPHQCEELDVLRVTVKRVSGYSLRCYNLDLAKGESVASFVQQFRTDYAMFGLDILMNNAGVVDSASGPEIFNVNFLGTYAVTKGLWGLLVDAAENGRDVRIVTTTSVERLAINQHMTQKVFAAWEASDYVESLNKTLMSVEAAVDDKMTEIIPVAYCFSKLADLMFALRLQDLVKGSPALKNIRVLSAHPGASHTLMTRNTDVGQMTRDQGALSNLRAITAPVATIDAGLPFFGPALLKHETEHYIELDSQTDDHLRQYALGRKMLERRDTLQPVEVLSCLQMIGAPMQYAHLRKVERDVELQQKFWQIAEEGLEQFYSTPWMDLKTEWHDLNIPAHMEPVTVV